MKREYFLIHLLEFCKCEIVRDANQGYSIVRNPINKKISGVPKNEQLKPATICLICNTLSIPIPNAIPNPVEFKDNNHPNLPSDEAEI